MEAAVEDRARRRDDGRAPFVYRETRRWEGVSRYEASVRLGTASRARPGVLLPDGRVIPDRRRRERRRDRARPVWLPGWASLRRGLFPHGATVSGPFRVTGRGYWRDGVGVIDWSLDEPISSLGVPVRVEIGNRFSGAYAVDELFLIDLPEGFTT